MFCCKIRRAPKIKSCGISQQYFKKEVRDKCDFYTSFLHVVTINLASISRHAQSTQNDKFAKSLQYLKKELGHEAFF